MSNTVDELEKGGTSHKNQLQPQETRATYLEPDEISQLPQEHREYLLQRHGTLELDPVPDFGGADPYNWPQWKVRVRHYDFSLPYS